MYSRLAKTTRGSPGAGGSEKYPILVRTIMLNRCANASMSGSCTNLLIVRMFDSVIFCENLSFLSESSNEDV